MLNFPHSDFLTFFSILRSNKETVAKPEVDRGAVYVDDPTHLGRRGNARISAMTDDFCCADSRFC